jgi:sodium/bile acid cotransporter 7
VVPIVVAQVMRQWQPIGGWASRHKHELSWVAQCGVLVMVLIGAVNCGESVQQASNGTILSAANVGLVIVAVSAVHSILLTSGFALSKALQFSRGDSIAVAFSGSQKTLMVGAYLALAVGPLAILPMVAYHAVQLVVDTLIADSLRQSAQSETNAAEFA